jgi:anthranilate phosphoribosyltransferase
MSSQCGSADVLEALGVRLELNAEQVAKCLETAGIGFMFAPAFHPAMKYAAAPRREIGIRTVFNILGPLTNPAGATAQVLGVAEESLIDKMARVLRSLGCRHALVVHGSDGLDEITISDSTLVAELKDGDIKHYTISPEDFGLKRASHDSLKGGDATGNAITLRRILAGEPGPARDIVLLNAAAVLLAGDRVATIKEGIDLAGEIIDSGQARAKLEQLIKVSQSF